MNASGPVAKPSQMCATIQYFVGNNFHRLNFFLGHSNNSNNMMAAATLPTANPGNELPDAIRPVDWE